MRGKVIAARASLGEIARANGLTPLPSATNFVTLDCGRDGDYARAVLGELTARWASLSACPAWPRWTAASASALAVTAELAAFAEALPRARAALA